MCEFMKSYFQVIDGALEVLVVGVKVDLPVVEDVVGLLLHADEDGLELGAHGLDALNLGDGQD